VTACTDDGHDRCRHPDRPLHHRQRDHATMRAELANLADQIGQGLILLRRHL
jgi:hypothetical protein